jgi:hypothetical protein
VVGLFWNDGRENVNLRNCVLSCVFVVSSQLSGQCLSICYNIRVGGFMTNEQMIKEIAAKYELPVEQVALIWSVYRYALTECELSSNFTKLCVCDFIREKML